MNSRVPPQSCRLRECSLPSPVPLLSTQRWPLSWTVCFYSPSFSLWFCLKYLYPYTIYCLVLHVFELYVNGIVEEEYASAPCSFHSPLSWDSTMSFVVLQGFTALYDYNTFYFSPVDGHFSLFQIFLLLHMVLPSVSPGMFVRGIL